MKQLWINGHYIEVTDEVYSAYVKGQRKMDYFQNELKTEHVFRNKDGSIKKIVPSREDSFDRLVCENSVQFPDDGEKVEDQVQRHDSIRELHIALKQLTNEERIIIKMLFYDEMKERGVASVLGISQAAVNKKKHRILKKLKKIKNLNLMVIKPLT